MLSRRLAIVRRKRFQLLGAIVFLVTSTLVAGVGTAAAADPSAADPPTPLTPTITGSGVSLTWTPPVNLGTDSLGNQASILGYNVYVTGPGGASETEGTSPICSPVAPSCLLTGLTPGVQYNYYVTTLNSVPLESLPSVESTFTFEIQQLPLSITTTSATYDGSSFTLDLVTSGGSGSGALSYSLANGGTASGCAVNGATLTANTSGNCRVTATMADDGTYLATSSPVTTVTFSKATQSPLAVTPLTGSYGTPLTLQSTGGTGTGALSYSLANGGTATNCLIIGTTLTASTAGTCLVSASQAGDTDYLAATAAAVAETFSEIAQAPLSITTTSATSTGTSYTLNLVTSGGTGSGAVTYSPVNGTASNCAVNGATLTATSAGTCLVTATKASDGDYSLASSLPTSVTFSEAVQSPLALTSLTGTYGTPLTLTSAGGSGTGAVSYSVAAGTASNCQVSASSPHVLTAASAGTCLVSATKASDGFYSATASALVSVRLYQAAQSALSLSSTSGTYGSSLSLAVSGGSGTGTVTFTASDGTAKSCLVSGSKLAAGSAGTCVVTATKAPSSIFGPVSSVPTTVTFAPAAQSALRLTTTSGTFGSPARLKISGGTGSGAVRYLVVGGTASQCRVSHFTLRATSAGTCVLRAKKAADQNYLAVTSHPWVFTFGRARQAPLSLSRTLGTYGQAITLAVVGGTGAGSESYRVSDLTASGCTLVTQNAQPAVIASTAGTCTVIIVKSADRNYLSASSRLIPLLFLRAAQSPLVIASEHGSVGSSLHATVRGGSGSGRLFVAVADGTATKCKLTATMVTAAAAGTCRVSATREGDQDFLATSVTATFTFQRLKQGAFVLSSARGTVGSALALAATGGSGSGVVRYELRGGTSRTCAISGATIKSTSVGTCDVVAVKKGDGTYRAQNSTVATISFANKPVHRITTVTPTSGLTSGSQLHVRGSGFTAHQRVLIAECLVGATSLAMCDSSNTRSVVVGSTGVLPLTLVTVVAGRIGSRTCGTTPLNLSACEIHLSLGAFTHSVVTPLHFVEHFAHRTLFVTPSSTLKNGEVVTLSGGGFTPRDTVYYAECLVGPITESRCALSTYKSVTISSTGDFPMTKVRVVTGVIGPGTCGTGADDAGACEISVANSSLSDATEAKLTFAVPH